MSVPDNAGVSQRRRAWHKPLPLPVFLALILLMSYVIGDYVQSERKRHAALELVDHLRSRGLIVETSLTDPTNVQFIDVNGARFSTGDARELSTLSGLEGLWLANLHAEDPDFYKAIGQLRSLKRLSLEKTFVTDEQFSHLAGLDCLTELCVEGTRLTRSSIVSVPRWFPRLEALHVYAINSDEAMQELPKLQRLKILSFFAENLSAPLLDAIARCKKIEWLRISANRCVPQDLATLQRLTKLQHLDLQVLDEHDQTDECWDIVGRFRNLRVLVVNSRSR